MERLLAKAEFGTDLPPSTWTWPAASAGMKQVSRDPPGSTRNLPHGERSGNIPAHLVHECVFIARSPSLSFALRGDSSLIPPAVGRPEASARSEIHCL